MDVEQLVFSAITGLVVGGISWGTIRNEVKNISKWTEHHEAKDDLKFDYVNNRIDIVRSEVTERLDKIILQTTRPNRTVNK